MKRFTWDFGCDCNFRCSYCFFTKAGWDNIIRLHAVEKSAETIEEAWKNIFGKYGKVRLYLTGGEPFLYRGFAGIVSKLSKYHDIHITTNLSLPVEEFIDKIDPLKVELNSTFHPLHSNPKTFAGNVARLRNAGFSCGVCYLAHPGQLKEMLNYKKYFKSVGIDMAVTLFWGDFGGREYPSAYTCEEKEYLEYCEKWSEDVDEYDLLFNNIESSITFGALQTNIEEIREGTFCGAGRDYAVVGVNGDVRPCGQSPGPILGNIYTGDVDLFSKAFECPVKHCRFRESDYEPE